MERVAGGWRGVGGRGVRGLPDWSVNLLHAVHTYVLLTFAGVDDLPEA